MPCKQSQRGLYFYLLSKPHKTAKDKARIRGLEKRCEFTHRHRTRTYKPLHRKPSKRKVRCNKKAKSYRKERREHPSFTAKQICQIVRDHMRR